MAMNETIGALIARLAQTNIELWHEEDKARLVKGLFAAITADGVIRPIEAALMRMVGGVLDCPLPPLTLDTKTGSPGPAVLAAAAA